MFRKWISILTTIALSAIGYTSCVGLYQEQIKQDRELLHYRLEQIIPTYNIRMFEGDYTSCETGTINSKVALLAQYAKGGIPSYQAAEEFNQKYYGLTYERELKTSDGRNLEIEYYDRGKNAGLSIQGQGIGITSWILETNFTDGKVNACDRISIKTPEGIMITDYGLDGMGSYGVWALLPDRKEEKEEYISSLGISDEQWKGIEKKVKREKTFTQLEERIIQPTEIDPQVSFYTKILKRKGKQGIYCDPQTKQAYDVYFFQPNKEEGVWYFDEGIGLITSNIDLTQVRIPNMTTKEPCGEGYLNLSDNEINLTDLVYVRDDRTTIGSNRRLDRVLTEELSLEMKAKRGKKTCMLLRDSSDRKGKLTWVNVYILKDGRRFIDYDRLYSLPEPTDFRDDSECMNVKPKVGDRTIKTGDILLTNNKASYIGQVTNDQPHQIEHLYDFGLQGWSVDNMREDVGCTYQGQTLFDVMTTEDLIGKAKTGTKRTIQGERNGRIITADQYTLGEGDQETQITIINGDQIKNDRPFLDAWTPLLYGPHSNEYNDSIQYLGLERRKTECSQVFLDALYEMTSLCDQTMGSYGHE